MDRRNDTLVIQYTEWGRHSQMIGSSFHRILFAMRLPDFAISQQYRYLPATSMPRRARSRT